MVSARLLERLEAYMNKISEKSFDYLPFLSAVIATYIARFLSADELEILSSLLASISAELVNIFVARSKAENSQNNEKSLPRELFSLPSEHGEK